MRHLFIEKSRHLIAKLTIWIKRSEFIKAPQTLVWVTGCFAEFILHVVGYKLKSSKSKMTYCALEIKWINGC